MNAKCDVIKGLYQRRSKFREKFWRIVSIIIRTFCQPAQEGADRSRIKSNRLLPINNYYESKNITGRCQLVAEVRSRYTRVKFVDGKAAWITGGLTGGMQLKIGKRSYK